MQADTTVPKILTWEEIEELKQRLNREVIASRQTKVDSEALFVCTAFGGKLRELQS